MLHYMTVLWTLQHQRDYESMCNAELDMEIAIKRLVLIKQDFQTIAYNLLNPNFNNTL